MTKLTSEESERKRKQSLKEKKQAYKSKEQLIQNALKNLDNQAKNNKIIFDDEILETIEKTVEKKSKSLFDDNNDDDNEDNEDNWNLSKLNFEKNKNEKLAKLQVKSGNDKRFILDERFLDTEDDKYTDKNLNENDTTEQMDVDNLKSEKEWTLNILEDVLGKPLRKPDDVPIPEKKKKGGMVRYDPTISEHKDYEVVVDNVKPKKKKSKGIKIDCETENKIEDKPIPVSTEIYYSVSDTLKNSLKENSGFSLLKTFGRAETPERDYDATTANLEVGGKRLKLTSDEKNPFKYDSSDDDDVEDNLNEQNETKLDEQKLDVFTETNNFFFSSNDVRFNEAKIFFSKENISSEEFQKLRRELKQIVRAKVRNNMKRNNVPGNKRKIKRKQ